MNFTREPIIETIITPKEGCKLVVRNSKAEGQEEYMVDAVEVVSFGHSMFFRSTEKPKPFLVPVSDYEVIEAKESRVVLKSAQFDRTIKIGGGRDASIRREAQEEEEPAPAPYEESSEPSSAPDTHFDRKRDRRRRRHRRPSDEREEIRPRTPPQESSSEASPAQPPAQESSASVFTHLIPPPTTLISETIGRYKEMLIPEAPKLPPVTPTEEAAQNEEEDDNDEGDTNSLSRVTTSTEPQSFQTTQAHFSNVNHWSSFLS